MTSEAGIDFDRNPLPFMAILTSFRIRFMQDIADQGRPVAAVRVVTGTAVYRFFREIGMLLPNRGT